MKPEQSGGVLNGVSVSTNENESNYSPFDAPYELSSLTNTVISKSFASMLSWQVTVILNAVIVMQATDGVGTTVISALNVSDGSSSSVAVKPS